MGSGASFDSALTDLHGGGFFCHSCHRVLSREVDSSDRRCPHCNSTFIEELDQESRLMSSRQRYNGQLSLEQARRIANATAMLRLLETQLREELENLQRAFEAANTNYENRRKNKMSKIMRSHLRKAEVTLDQLCGQPSCPICSEDFAVGTKATSLPCGHMFHGECVLPWLEQKQNCPICRLELPSTAPSNEHLLQLGMEELIDLLRDIGIEIPDAPANDKNFLVELLQKKLQEIMREDQSQPSIQMGTALVGPPIVNFTFRTFGPVMPREVSEESRGEAEQTEDR